MSLAQLEGGGFERPRLLSEHVYEQLKSMILTNKFQPGQALVEERIASKWGVSRTPLRAALGRLERDGLVRTFPHKGYAVADIRPEDVRDLHQVREALEVTAIQLATPCFPDEELAQLARLFAEIDADLAEERYEKYIRSDAEFHARILAHVPNRRLPQMLAKIYDELTRIRNFSHGWPGEHMREAHEEHARILEAMRRRDSEAASAAMREHLRNVTRRAISLLRQPASQIEETA